MEKSKSKSKSKNMRLDLWLVGQGLTPSRTKARELIKSNQVEVCWKGRWTLVNLPHWGVPSGEDFLVRLVLPDLLKYVSRAGLKLEAALKHIELSVEGITALDIGQSTGGFTDCLLQAGCKAVVGLDVGHGQLHPKIKTDPRVVSFEGVNVRGIHLYPELSSRFNQGYGLVVIDVSFVSLTQVIPVVAKLMNKGERMLALVKPQFEVGAHNLNKRGVVRSQSEYDKVQVKIRNCAESENLKVLAYFESGLIGADGNQEFFIFLERNGK